MTLEFKEEDFEKALEQSLSQVLSREDTWLLRIRNTIKYLISILFNKLKYRDYQLHNNKLSVIIPDFFNHNQLDFGDLVSEEFNYRRKIAISFAIQKSSKSIGEFLIYRKNEVDTKDWSYMDKPSFNITSKYCFSPILFQHKTLAYYKSLFIRKINDDYLVITIVAPKKYFLDDHSFIHQILLSFSES